MRVSIYLPTRNRHGQLKAAVRSVQQQTYADLELLIVNDASTDDTREYLEELKAKDHRVRVFNNATSAGGPTSRNIAISASSGEYLTGLDDDDEFEPYRIDLFVEMAHSLNKSGVSSSCLYSQEKWISNGVEVNLTKKPGSVEWRDLAMTNSIGNQIFARKEVFLGSGLYEPSMPAWQDLDLFVRVLRKYGKARLVDAPSYIFDVSPRPDRVSSKRAAVLEACERLGNSQFADDPRAQQQLMLQVFSDYYGFKPSISHLARFLTKGPWLRGSTEMLKRLSR